MWLGKAIGVVRDTHKSPPVLDRSGSRKGVTGKRLQATALFDHEGNMRINVYSQELTDEVIMIEKLSNTGITYHAAQLILHSSDKLHHSPEDDDRSAVTFWLPSSSVRLEDMARAFENIAAIFRSHKP